MLAESGVGWLPYFLARADLEWQRPARQDRRLCTRHPAERAVPPPGDGHVRGGRARRRAHPAARCRLVHVGVGLPAHRQHVPRIAARDRRDARRAAPTTTAARSPRPTAPSSTAWRRVVSHVTGADRAASTTSRFRCSDADAMVAFYRALGFDGRRDRRTSWWCTSVTR